MIITNGAKYNSVQIVDTDLDMVYFGDFIIDKKSASFRLLVIYKGWRIIYNSAHRYSTIQEILLPSIGPLTISGGRVTGSDDIGILSHNYKYFNISGRNGGIMNVNLICGGLRRDAYFDGKMTTEPYSKINYYRLTRVIRLYF